MKLWYKNPIFLIILALILIGGGMLLFRDGGENSGDTDNNDNTSTTVREGEVEVMGEIACLPYSVNVAGQECVKGVKGDDGKMYALNSISVNALENTMSEGTKVTAIGVYQPANVSVSDSSSFEYDGVLVLRSLKKR